MSRESDLYDAHQRDRWLRPDAERWIRPDAARFYLPGTDLADVIPALARKRDEERAAEAKAIARELEALEALRDELMEVKAELARRRLEDEAKYSPSQPRVPAGNPRGGQWTDGSGGQSQGGGLSQDPSQSPDADLTQPMGNVDIGDVSGSSELGDLFKIKPDGASTEGTQLAVDFNQVTSDGKPVTDIDGSPYYASQGHHEMPEGVYSKWDLSPETAKVFNQSTTGELPKGRVPIDDSGMPQGHYWDGPRGRHRQYNDAVKELSENFMRDRNITPETMTPDHARDLLQAVRESEDPRIRDYNRMVRMLRRIFRLRGGRE